MSTNNNSIGAIEFVFGALAVLILTVYGMIGYLIVTGGYQHRNRATLETVIVSKELGYENSADMRSNKLRYVYTYVTFADRKLCEQVDDRFRSIKVGGKVYECPSDTKEVPETQWQKLNVGDVLKVVELK